MVAGWFVQVWVPWRGLRWPVESSQGSMTAVCLLIPEPLSRYSSAMLRSVLAVVGGVLHWWHCVCVLNEGLAWVLVCIWGYCFYHFIGLWSAPTHLHMCVDECTNTFVFLLFSLMWYSGFPYISLYTPLSAFDFWKLLFTEHCIVCIRIHTDVRLQHTPSMSVADSPDVHMNICKYT